MTKIFLRVLMVALWLGIGSVVQAKSADYNAGYHDGCSSAKGHYTRSRYKYANSSRYHKGWLRGKRACAKPRKRIRHRKHTRKVTHRTVKRSNVGSCNTEVPWDAFRKGWRDGLASAKGRFHVDHRGCEAYRKGWVSGYRSCHCGELRKPTSYTEGYYQGCASTFEIRIRNDYYYERFRPYRHGWIQGYRDCRGDYR